MFRFVCELCRQSTTDRKKSVRQLRNFLNYAATGTIAYIADQNPHESSIAQSVRVVDLLKQLFPEISCDSVGFYEFNREYSHIRRKYPNETIRNELHDSGLWDIVVTLSLVGAYEYRIGSPNICSGAKRNVRSGASLRFGFIGGNL